MPCKEKSKDVREARGGNKQKCWSIQSPFWTDELVLGEVEVPGSGVTGWGYGREVI